MNLYDFNARMYDANLGRFNSIDPLADQQESFNPYHYSYNSPVLLKDPTGLLADFFDEEGNYLGNDGQDTDDVQIISKEKWDENKTVNDDGTESIDAGKGKEESTKFSKSGLKTRASLKVYQHYNPTDLPIRSNLADGGSQGGMDFRVSGTNKSLRKGIHINLKSNARYGYSDHANEIKNMFVHEEKHYDDFKMKGGDIAAAKDMVENRDRGEVRAVYTQMAHPTFSKTRKSFQRSSVQYGKDHGMVVPLPVRYTGSPTSLPKFR